MLTHTKVENRVNHKVMLFKSQRYLSNLFYKIFFFVLLGWVVVHPNPSVAPPQFVVLRLGF